MPPPTLNSEEPVISASTARGSGRPCSTAGRLSCSSLTRLPATDSLSPQSWPIDAIEGPVFNIGLATS